jgi:hypothetical protein
MLLINLINNAVKYGTCAEVGMDDTTDTLRFTVAYELNYLYQQGLRSREEVYKQEEESSSNCTGHMR